MIEVQMESLTTEDAAYKAAFASLLELSLDDLPGFEGLSSRLQWDAWVASELNLWTLRQVSIEVPPGMWLARVLSPYPGYGLHTVVMASAFVAFDPHPEPQPVDVVNGIAQCEVLLPLDPSRLSGPAAMSDR